MANMTDEEFNAEYPEHAKATAVATERQAIGEFIEHGGYVLCEWPEGQAHPRATNKSINDVLAEYYKIDMKILEAEKQRMLKALAGDT